MTDSSKEGPGCSVPEGHFCRWPGVRAGERSERDRVPGVRWLGMLKCEIVREYTDSRMILVVDENIAAARDAFSRYGDVRLLSGRAIDRTIVADADALLVRSITRVDRELLEGSSVRFVGTATIGRNHIDEEYLWKTGITLVDAAGAGARSVAEYAATALLTLHNRRVVRLPDAKVAIVGVGAIGSLVSRFVQSLGVAETIEYDPPRHNEEPEFESATIEHVKGADVIILAIPLTSRGLHPTHHMIDESFLTDLETGSTLINVARGGVVDSTALKRELLTGRLHAVLDVWEDEPEVDPDLLGPCTIATPHIAGYSRDGKLRGTEMLAQGLAEHIGSTEVWHPSATLSSNAGTLTLDTDSDDLHNDLLALLLHTCPIDRDDAALRTFFPLTAEERRAGFDRLRKEYPVRREFPAWRIDGASGEVRRIAEELGFVSG